VPPFFVSFVVRGSLLFTLHVLGPVHTRVD
jgi:hypothetical protein